MKHIIFVFIFFSSIKGYTQSGFIQAYDFGNPGFGINNTLNINDTIYLTGTARQQDSLFWCAYLAIIDSSGNLIGINYYYLVDDNIGAAYNSDIIKTTDGGLAMISNSFQRANPILIKTDRQGKLEFMQEYDVSEKPAPAVHDILIETPNGYMLGGSLNQGNNLLDISVVYVNKKGELMWKKTYGEKDWSENGTSAYLMAENLIMIAGGSGYPDPKGKDNQTRSNVIFIDSLGSIVKVWKSEVIDTFNKLGGGWIEFEPISAGFLSINIRPKYLPYLPLSDNEFQTILQVVKRDIAFNIIWAKEFNDKIEQNWGFNRLFDIKLTPDSGIIVVGKRIGNLNDPMYHTYTTGWMIKLDKNGKELWSRLDTLFYFDNGLQDHQWTGVNVLSGGSIVSVGYIDLVYFDLPPDSTRSIGWVMKVDECGCIIPGCNTKVSTNVEQIFKEIKIFPNPAHNMLQVKAEGKYDIEIYDVAGKKYFNQKGYENNIMLPINSLISGTYIIKLIFENHIAYNKIFVKI